MKPDFQHFCALTFNMDYFSVLLNISAKTEKIQNKKILNFFENLKFTTIMLKFKYK